MENDIKTIDANALIKSFENLPSDNLFEEIWFKNTVLETIKNAPAVISSGQRPKAEWIYTEFVRHYDEGGSLLIKGFKCSNCGFMRKKSHGKCNFCEECGYDMNMLQEECAELIQAVSKYKRTRTTAIVEEMADVYIMLYQITYLLNKEVASVDVEDYIALWMEKKIRRQLERIQNGGQVHETDQHI